MNLAKKKKMKFATTETRVQSHCDYKWGTVERGRRWGEPGLWESRKSPGPGPGGAARAVSCLTHGWSVQTSAAVVK